MPAGSGDDQPQQTIMIIRTSPRDYAFAVVALLALLSGVETVRGQQQSEMDIWMAASSDLSAGRDAGRSRGQRANIR